MGRDHANKDISLLVGKTEPAICGRDEGVAASGIRGSVEPSMSTQIEKGTEWFEELRNALDNAHCGILCLTPEAIGSPWIHFEAGLLVQALSQSPDPQSDSARESCVRQLSRS